MSKPDLSIEHRHQFEKSVHEAAKKAKGPKNKAVAVLTHVIANAKALIGQPAAVQMAALQHLEDNTPYVAELIVGAE